MDTDEVFKQIDKLFEENKVKEAEQFMLASLEEAKAQADDSTRLQLLNELIGYYRQTSEWDRLQDVIDQSLELAEKMGLKGTVPYATTTLNVATGYRAMGENEKSLQYYKITEEIYEKGLAANDMLVANFYNNYSLLCQELKDYDKSEECLQKALAITRANNAGFETAVTCANLANTCVLAEHYDKAREYAAASISYFKENNWFDAHYCAAVSALGMCEFHDKAYEKAEELFTEGMNIVEKSFGHNTQYEKMKENRDACIHARSQTDHGTDVESRSHTERSTVEPSNIKGLELCRRYYETYGKPMIEEQFPEYADKIAVGLVGEGSDCMGFDDAVSMDHDWGPDFCMWVTDETYEKIGNRLEQAYAALPKTFMGYERTRSPQGAGRRGVMTISAFYQRMLGVCQYEKIDWRNTEDYAFAAAVNGEVFRDDEGIFTKVRNQILRGYPEQIHFLKLAEDVAHVSQTGQYNYFRMMERGDRLTADQMLSDCMKWSMRLWHHILGVYPPHDKWLYQSTLKLDKGKELMELLSGIHACMNVADASVVSRVRTLTEQLGAFFARELYARHDISDIDSYIDMHTDELLDKAGFSVCSDQELVDQIVKLEFEAFDKVKNEGGRASCQNDWPTFSVMRKSQYLTWNRIMLMQYLYDFKREYYRGHNLITEKYGRMMESTAPERYEEIKDNFPELSDQKKAVIEQIVAIQMEMMEAFAKEHPNVAQNARSLHTYEDNIVNTSYETYLRGEISTYSDKMLQLYGQYVVQCASTGRNIARETIENTARLYGYANIEQMEELY